MQDSVCHIAMETRVYGSSPYAPGVSKIVEAVHARTLENRSYAINEFIENGWV
jgi:mannose/cellobiose epimerase-like protein (N-acyl-D-glucosamine 2-epimerase family)